MPGERRYENGTALELKQQHTCIYIVTVQGWSDGAMVLGTLPVPGRPTIWMIVGQEPIAFAVGAGGGCLDIFTLYLFSPLSLSVWMTTR